MEDTINHHHGGCDYLAFAREEKNKTLRLATDKLASEGHISTQYPPQWMPKPTLVDKLPRVLWTLFYIILIALFVWCSATAQEESSIAIVSVLTGFYPFVIIISALWFCSMFALEYVEKLHFRAVQLLVVGACVNVVFGKNNFLSHASISEEVGSFFGTAILSLGTIMVSVCLNCSPLALS